jgi:single-strand DNA-binding protein
VSRGINKVIAIGNLGKDPETKYLPSGAAVCNFSIAVSENWKDKQTGEQKERTEWINVEVWGNSAEACQKYLNKGSQCYIEGKLQTDMWEKDGEKKYRTKVRADSVQFLGSAGAGKRNASAPAAPAADQKFDDDIPF